MSEGSVYQRKDRRWCGKYKDVTGKWRYVYRKTKTEAKQALRQALKDRDDRIIPANKMTVAVLLDEWLKEMASEVSVRTLENREGIIRLHVQPIIGSKKLARVDQEDIRNLLRAKSEQLAPSTVKRIYAFLNQAFEFAVSRKHISRNPVPEVKPPKQYRREIVVLKTEQIRHLLDSVKGTRYEPIIVLGATCGLRVGEALSLRWEEDIDLDKGTVSVRRTLWKGKTYQTKTECSTRTLKLPRLALDTLTQCDRRGDWLCSTRNNTPVSAPNFHLVWKKMLRRAKLDEATTFHQLRHGAASLMLNQNVPIPVVSRYLGHSTPRTTMTTYAHMIDGMGGMAAEGIDEALG